MVDKSESIESLLLDWHLGRLEATQRVQIEEALTRSPELALRSQRLRTLLSLLDADEPVPPPDLAGSVMARIQERTKVIPLPEVSAARSVHEVAARGPSLALRDVIAIAACVALFVGIAVPGYFKAHNVSLRHRCQNHLHQISDAMASYGQAHAGFLPYASYIPGGTWLPGQGRNVPRASNTRHVFKLVRQGYIRNVRVFLCPASKDGRPMLADDYRQFTDFAERANNSYSFLFMNWPKGLRPEDMRKGAGGKMVLVADRNPHFAGTPGALERAVAVRLGNSLLHENGAGQNAIRVDGSGGWFTSPNIGVDHDDIYKAGGVVQYQGTERPVSETDTFLP